jgi:predicted amidohydrolase YtcJ
LLGLALLVHPALSFAAEPMQVADTVLLGGRIVTLDAAERTVESLAIREGRVLAVGDDAAIRKLIGERTQIIRLDGKTILPGLIESHCHSFSVARASLTQPWVELPNIPAIQAWIRHRAKEVPAGRWLEVPRTDITRIPERRHPTPAELDAACTTHPVVYTAAQKHVLNSLGFRMLGIIDKTSTIPDGEIVRDGDGRPVLIRGGHQLLRQTIPQPEYTREEIQQSLAGVHRRYNEVGITTIFERAIDPEGVGILRSLRERGQLSVRVCGTFHFSARTAEQVEAYIKGLGLQPRDGDDWFKAGPLKITADGGIHWGTTRLSEPYGDKRIRFYRLTDPQYRGDLFYPVDQMTMVFETANRHGWQMSAHITGDAGVERVLDAVEAVAAKDPSIRERRFTLIHAYFPSPALARRARQLGVCVDTQCYLYYKDSDAIAEVYGEPWAKRFIGLGDWFRAGVPVAINSDHMIGLDPNHAMNSFNPFLTLYIAISRKNQAGRTYDPSQKLSRLDALRAMTLSAAYLGFEETRAGSLEPGKYADLVMIDRDYLTCPEEEIRDIKVLRTMVAGKTVFERRER